MKPSAEALFERYRLRAYQYFRRRTGRHDVAEDLTQELFLRVVRGLDTYEPIGREAAWVFRAARNLALNYFRKVNASVERDWDEAASRSVDPDPVAAFGLTEGLALLNAADLDLLLLHEVVGLNYRELAEACETTPAAVSQRLYRVRARLRRLLGSRVVGTLGERDG